MQRLFTVMIFSLWVLALPTASTAASETYEPRRSLPESILVLHDPVPMASTDELKDSAQRKVERHQYEDAQAIYREIAFREPTNLDVLIRLADLHAWTQDYDHSITLYKDIVRRDTVNLAAMNGLARVLRWAGRFAEAEGTYQRILSVEAANVEALTGLALTFAQHRDLESALACIDKACRLSGYNSHTMLIKGDILSWSGRYTDAEQIYNDVLKLHPADPEIYRSLGNVYKWNGQPAKSIEMLNKAHTLDPRNVEYLVDLAEVALTAGALGEADEAVKNIFSVAPDDPRGYKLLRELRAHNSSGVLTVIDTYFKPFSLVASIVGISFYFHRKRMLIQRRHPYFWRFAYQILPATILLLIGVFVAVRQIGAWNADLIEKAAEFMTFLFLVGAFVWLVRASRLHDQVKGKSILVIGAHPDDIELGCGGTLVKFKEMGYSVHGLVITSGEQGNPHPHGKLNRRLEAERGAVVLGLDNLWVCSFRDTQLESQLKEIKDMIEEKIEETQADIIITQSPHDLHQDHRSVFEATKIAARGDKTLLCYEDVSTEPHFAANFFVDVTEYLDDKIEAVQSHRTQKGKLYMHPENIRGRAAHRGLQSGVQYAEAFLLYKGVDTWTS